MMNLLLQRQALLIEMVAKLAANQSPRGEVQRLADQALSLKLEATLSSAGRAALAAKAKGRPPVQLQLVEWLDQPPTPVSVAEASTRLGYSTSTIRNMLSQSAHGGFTCFRHGRHVALLRDPAKLELVLRERFEQTGDPDQLVTLAKKPRTSTSRGS